MGNSRDVLPVVGDVAPFGCEHFKGGSGRGRPVTTWGVAARLQVHCRRPAQGAGHRGVDAGASRSVSRVDDRLGLGRRGDRFAAGSSRVVSRSLREPDSTAQNVCGSDRVAPVSARCGRVHRRRPDLYHGDDRIREGERTVGHSRSWPDRRIGFADVAVPEFRIGVRPVRGVSTTDARAARPSDDPRDPAPHPSQWPDSRGPSR